MACLPIPKRAEDITASWMTAALKLGGNAAIGTVREVRVSRIGLGIGLIGGLYRCHLSYESEISTGPESVVIKMQSPDRKSAKVGKRFSLYRKEHSYYTKIAPVNPLRSPKLYYADFNKRNHAFVLVLEDVGHMQVHSQIAGGTPEQGRLAVRGAAMMHAKFWQLEEEPALNRYFSNFSPAFVMGVHAFCRAGVQAMFDLFPEDISSSMQKLIWKFAENATMHFQQVGSGARTLIHGDYRLDNMFFATDGPNDLAVVDWQSCAIGIGPGDISYFLSGSFEPEVRRQFEAEALEEYCEIICRQGTGKLTLADCWRSYRENMISSLAIPMVVCAGLSLESDDGSAELVRTGVHRLMIAMEEHEVYEFAPDRKSGAVGVVAMNALGNRLGALMRRLSR